MRRPAAVLFSYTPNVERVCAAAMRSCYSSHPASELYKGESNSPKGKERLTAVRISQLLEKATGMGHMSVLEHGLFTFDLQNVSRSLTHQLVRHRLASYSQQSQRHVAIDAEDEWYAMPPSLDKEARRRFSERMESIARWYREERRQAKLPLQDARFYLPNATLTNLVVSMNPRELLHFFSLRCVADAQWEIRAAAWAMLACSKLVAPAIFRSIPRLGQDKCVEERVEKLTGIVERLRKQFERTLSQQVLEIPLRDLGLEYEVRALVNRI